MPYPTTPSRKRMARRTRLVLAVSEKVEARALVESVACLNARNANPQYSDAVSDIYFKQDRPFATAHEGMRVSIG